MLDYIYIYISPNITRFFPVAFTFPYPLCQLLSPFETDWFYCYQEKAKREKREWCAIVVRTCVQKRKKKREERERSDDKEEGVRFEGRGKRVVRVVVVHLSLISRGRSRLATFLLPRIEGRIEGGRRRRNGKVKDTESE